MVKAGRPQGGLKGATQEANALAEFLREVTEGLGVRELAGRYEGVGKTLWGDYRSGARIIPLGRLNAAVKDRYRDARSQQIMLARARSLYEAAIAAEAGGESTVRPDAATSPQATTVASAAVREEPTGEPDGQDAGRNSENRPEAPSPEATGPDLHATDAEQSEQPTSKRVPVRDAGAALSEDAASSPDSKAANSGDLPPGAAIADGPGSSAGTTGRHGPVRVRWASAALVMLVAVSTAGGIFIATHQSDAAGTHDGPEVLLNPPPSSSGPGGDLNLPGTGPSAPADDPGATENTPSRRPAPASSGAVVSKVAGTAYTVTRDRSAVMKWTNSGGWKKVGDLAADKVYAGQAGVFATNPDTGDIYALHEPDGSWQKIGGPGAQFTVKGSSLYALTPTKNAVMRWSGQGTKWDSVGGPAKKLYAGGAGLFATNPDTGVLYRYSGPGRGWHRAGGPGAEFAIGDDFIAGLSPDRDEVWMADGEGEGWHRIGGPALHLYAGGAGLFATNPDTGQILKYTGKPGIWTPMGEAGTAHAVDGRSVYRIAKDTAAVERWTGGTTWTPLDATAGVVTTG